MSIRAVFFDVDFTLIYPGPTFRGEGYRAFCDRYGITVEESAFERAVAAAAPLLDGPDDTYDAAVFVRYARSIIEGMGGSGDRVEACAREIYDEWAACHHFELYEEVPTALRTLAGAGLRIGLISNSHRCLTSFQSHFDLAELVSGAVSGHVHGFMKPNPSIFQAALRSLDVSAGEAMMVGDNVRQDVDGALNVGMKAVLLHRGTSRHPEEAELTARGVPIVHALEELGRVFGLLGSNVGRVLSDPASEAGPEGPALRITLR
jgi:putative hydrolase of the HAD superfamily